MECKRSVDWVVDFVIWQAPEERAPLREGLEASCYRAALQESRHRFSATLSALGSNQGGIFETATGFPSILHPRKAIPPEFLLSAPLPSTLRNSWSVDPWRRP